MLENGVCGLVNWVHPKHLKQRPGTDNVPHGSVLGLVLFMSNLCLFANDITKGLVGKLCLFADDIMVWNRVDTT